MRRLPPFSVTQQLILRSPNWRWQRANQLIAEEQRFNAGRDDPETGRAVRYLQHLSRKPRRGRARGNDTFDDIKSAHALHDRTMGDSLMIECLMLNGADNDQIARQTGQHPNVIAVYGDLFYDVRPHLAVPDWIILRAVNLRAPVGDMKVHPETLLRRMAYGAPRGELLSAFPIFRSAMRQPGKLPPEPSTDDPIERSAWRWICFEMVPDSVFMSTFAVEMNLRIQKSQRKTDTVRQMQSPLNALMEAYAVRFGRNRKATENDERGSVQNRAA